MSSERSKCAFFMPNAEAGPEPKTLIVKGLHDEAGDQAEELERHPACSQSAQVAGLVVAELQQGKRTTFSPSLGWGRPWRRR